MGRALALVSMLVVAACGDAEIGVAVDEAPDGGERVDTGAPPWTPDAADSDWRGQPPDQDGDGFADSADCDPYDPAVTDRYERSCSGACGEGMQHCEQGQWSSCDTEGSACRAEHADGTCVGDLCVVSACDEGYGDCDDDASNGCESSLSTAQHCGACGVLCGPDTPVCALEEGTRACDSDCGEDAPTLCGDACVDTESDVNHCGGCGQTCHSPNGMSVCIGGHCGVADCEPGFGDCDGNAGNGCEQRLDTAEHCGACGAACGPDTPVCALLDGARVCESGCDEGAPTLCGEACVDTEDDVNHCGGCGQVCQPPHGIPVCFRGQCGLAACEPGFGDCDGNADNGCEQRLDTAEHCGACGQSCRQSGACEQGTPVCDPGAGSCRYSLRPAGTVCRSASGVCDAVETCDGVQSTCPDNRMAPLTQQCRASQCAGDIPETCGGSSSCPAACGCAGQPCCAGYCGDGLACTSGTCSACTLTNTRTGGLVEFGCDPEEGCRYFKSVGVNSRRDRIIFQDDGGSRFAIELRGDVRASGHFQIECNSQFCSRLSEVVGTGNQLIFRDSWGNEGAIMLIGATAVGSFTAQCYPEGCAQVLTVSGLGSGSDIVFTDAAHSETITLQPECR